MSDRELKGNEKPRGSWHLICEGRTSQDLDQLGTHPYPVSKLARTGFLRRPRLVVNRSCKFCHMTLSISCRPGALTETGLMSQILSVIPKVDSPPYDWKQALTH